MITVESSAVGLIIGRAGENMRRIEQSSGARVQFITGPDGSAWRECRITGQPHQRATAIAEINRVASENPHSASKGMPVTRPQPMPQNQPALKEGEKNIQIQVPDKTVGLIIGRGGETIRDLQSRSGCHVNIVGEDQSRNGLRPVNLIGTRSQADRAKSLIYEIVESDTRNGGTQPPNQQQQPYTMPPIQSYPPQPSYNSYGQPPPQQQQPERITDSVMVPSDAVGMIIGKSGETVKNMQNESNAKINVGSKSSRLGVVSNLTYFLTLGQSAKRSRYSTSY